MPRPTLGSVVRTLLGLALPLATVPLTACPPENTAGDASRANANLGDAGFREVDATLPSGDLVWLTAGGGAHDDRCLSSVATGDGTIVALCASESQGGAIWGAGSDNEVEVTSVGGADLVLLGLDPATGAIRWHKTVASGGNESAGIARMTSLADGRVAALIQVGGPITGDGINLPTALDRDLVLLVMTAAGAVEDVLTIARGDFLTNILGWQLSARSSGGLIVSGRFGTSLTVLPGSAGETLLVPNPNGPTAPDFTAFLLFLNASLDLDRVRTLGGPGESVNARAVESASGRLLLVGSFDPSFTLGHTATQVLVDDDGLGAAFVAKLDANDEPLWAISFGSAGGDYARNVVETADGGVVTTGFYGQGVSAATMHVPGLGGVVLPGAVGNQFQLFVLALSSTGVPRWLRGFTAEGSATGWTVGALDNNDVVVSGTASFGSDILRQGRFSDGEVVTLRDPTSLLVRYRGDDGSRVWTRLTGPAGGFGATVRPDGSVVQYGQYYWPAMYAEGEPNQTEPPYLGLADGVVGLYAP